MIGFLRAVAVLCFIASITFGYLAFTVEPMHAVSCLVMGIAGWLFLGISRIGGNG